MKPKNKLTLNILGKKHPVRLHKKPVPYGKERRWGQIGHGDRGIIDIYVGSEYMIFDTLTHETLHSVLESLGYKKLSEDEGFVRQLSVAITEVITVNKGTLLKILGTQTGVT